jgi:biotin carboxyl carrier protein
LQFQATVLSHETFDQAAAAFATELASMLHFDRAALGFSDNAQTRVVATSHTADFKSSAALFGAFSAAMDEALDQGTSIAYPAAPGGRPLITLAHTQLSRHYGGATLSVPLVSRGSAFGALTLARAESTPVTPEEIALCEHLACIVGPVLELKRESERSWYARLAHTARDLVRKVRQPGHTHLKAGAVGALAALLAALLIPVEHRIGAQARIEGSVQRALVAPSDGFLRQVHARPGDTVKADQVLAELAEDELRLEQRKWQSELTQHENAASGALARTDRGQYVINQAKADEARAQVDLVERQLSRTRITAPFAGVVIKGDLTQSLGAPVRRGDVLMTVAPADQFRLIVEVDERDVASVRVGQKGHVALGALSDRSLAFRVRTVTPVAVARDGGNFFEVTGDLEDSPAMLRPGLKGVAKIDAGSQTIAWVWTHRLTDWLRLSLWSLGG